MEKYKLNYTPPYINNCNLNPRPSQVSLKISKIYSERGGFVSSTLWNISPGYPSSMPPYPMGGQFNQNVLGEHYEICI